MKKPTEEDLKDRRFVAERLIYWRERRGYTQTEAAEKAGVSLSTIRRTEAMERDIKYVELIKLAAFYGVGLEEFEPPNKTLAVTRARSFVSCESSDGYLAPERTLVEVVDGMIHHLQTLRSDTAAVSGDTPFSQVEADSGLDLLEQHVAHARAELHNGGAALPSGTDGSFEGVIQHIRHIRGKLQRGILRDPGKVDYELSLLDGHLQHLKHPVA